MRALHPALAVPLLGGGDGALGTQPAIHGWLSTAIVGFAPPFGSIALALRSPTI
jgi:hypothetical protein